MPTRLRQCDALLLWTAARSWGSHEREVDLGDRVWFDRDKVSVVLDGVRRHLSPETDWGFNYEDDRAWVIAESSVDLQALVDDALAAR